MTIFDKLFIASVFAALLLNPLSGSFVLMGVNAVLDYLMTYGPSIIAAPIAYIGGYITYTVTNDNRSVFKKLRKA